VRVVWWHERAYTIRQRETAAPSERGPHPRGRRGRRAASAAAARSRAPSLRARFQTPRNATRARGIFTYIGTHGSTCLSGPRSSSGGPNREGRAAARTRSVKKRGGSGGVVTSKSGVALPCVRRYRGHSRRAWLESASLFLRERSGKLQTRRRVRSVCRSRESGTEYLSDSGAVGSLGMAEWWKQSSNATEPAIETALRRTRSRPSAGRRTTRRRRTWSGKTPSKPGGLNAGGAAVGTRCRHFAAGPEGNVHRVGPTLGQTLGRRSGFLAKLLGQLASIGPTL
jgi:hypothetical protein